jgi:hypothetical protein
MSLQPTDSAAGRRSLRSQRRDLTKPLPHEVEETSQKTSVKRKNHPDPDTDQPGMCELDIQCIQLTFGYQN